MKKVDSHFLIENLREYNSSTIRQTPRGIPAFGDWGNKGKGTIEKETLWGDKKEQDALPSHNALSMKEDESVFDIEQPFIKAGVEEQYSHKKLFQKTKHPPYYEPALQDDFIAEVEEKLTERIRSKTFRMRDFIQAESAIEYADEHLKKLGCGSSRCSYLLTPKTVLKVARDDLIGQKVRGGFEAGVAQNEAEYHVSTGLMNDVVAKVLRKSNTFEWIVSELVHQFKPDDTEDVTHGIPIERFEDIAGISFYDFSEVMSEMQYHDITPREALMKMLVDRDHEDGDIDWSWDDIYDLEPEEFKEEFGESRKEAAEPYVEFVRKEMPKAIELLEGIKELVEDFGTKTADLEHRPEHFGMTASGRLVVLDYGFDEQVKQSFYEQLTNEPYQQDMRRMHPRWKNRLIGKGGNKTSVYPGRPSMKRAKSAPPNAPQLGEIEKPEFRNQDALDAIEHADIDRDQNWTLDDFKLRYLGELKPKFLRKYEDIDSWLDFDEQDAKELSKEEKIEALKNFRGEDWAEMALGWLKTNSIPPVFLITAPLTSEDDLYTQVGDGRGRVNFAMLFNRKVPVYHLIYKK